MNPGTRRIALYAIGLVAVLASVDALAHSYTGLYEWAAQHRLSGWQAMSWPAEIDVFLVVGELALYVAYLDTWPARQRMWPWTTAIVGLVVSVAGNVGHVQAPATTADRVTAAVSPVAAFAGLMIGLLVLKMSAAQAPAGSSVSLRAVLTDDAPDLEESAMLADAIRILQAGSTNGERVSQRMLAAQLRENGHRFSNSRLRDIAEAAYSRGDDRAAA